MRTKRIDSNGRFYDAIVSKAGEVGWPVRHQDDLKVYDLSFVRRQATEPGGIDGQAYIWGLYESGTLIFRADLKNIVGSIRSAVDAFYPMQLRWFVWEDKTGELREVTTDEAVAWATEQAEIMKAESRPPMGFRHLY